MLTQACPFAQAVGDKHSSISTQDRVPEAASSSTACAAQANKLSCSSKPGSHLTEQLVLLSRRVAFWQPWSSPLSQPTPKRIKLHCVLTHTKELDGKSP